MKRFVLGLLGLWLAVVLGATEADAQVLEFPATPVGATAAAQAVVVTAAGGGTVASVRIRTMGSEGYDYQNAGGGTCSAGASLAPGASCTVMVSFQPKAPGDRHGAVVLLDASHKTLGMALLDGTATGSLGVFVPGLINTVAGDSYWIYSSDGTPATQSSIFLPYGIAVDAAGNQYIADTSNARIRMVSAATGMISTLGGETTIGYTGDGGLAVNAEINNPTSIALDPAGNVYFADDGNNIIRRIDAFTGVMTTVAGTPLQHGYAGDGGAATGALLNGPNGICFDAQGNLYIADTGNHVVREVLARTGTMVTFAGTGTPAYTGDGGLATLATLNQPWGLAYGNGTLYIAEQGNSVVRAVNAAGTISTFAGSGISGSYGDGGAATLARLNVPSGVVVDVAGNVYVADTGNNRVRKVSATTGNISTVAGTGGESFYGDGMTADVAGLYGPYGLALDSNGNLYIADVFHNRIRELSANATILQYSAIRVGRVSPAQKQTVENDGNAALNVASLAAVLNSQIDPTTTTCFQALVMKPLDQCVMGVEFAPTTTGNPVLGTANFNSDAGNTPAVVTVSGQVLDVDPTTLALVSSENPSLTGDNVTFTVTASSAGTTPTGAVTFLDGTTVLGTVQLSSGIANLATTALIAGSHSITVSYPGDSSNSSATSGALVQVVKDPIAATTTVLASSSSPVVAGAALKLTASVATTVAGAGTGTMGGSVTFFDGANSLGAAAVTNGTATLSVTTLTPGTHTLTALYGGDTHYGTSTSAALSEKVTAATTGAVLTTSANPMSAGGAVMLTATLTGNGGVPTGMVTFLDGATTLGKGTLNGTGVATLTVTGANWTVGAHTLTASYAGDTQNTASTSATVTETVVLATTSTAVGSSQNPIGQGAPVMFTATVTGTGGMPTGTVKFTAGTTVLGTVALNAAGNASVTTTTLPQGSANVVATYSGDAFDAASASSALVEVVNQAATVVALGASKNPATFGDSVVLTATVTGTGATATGVVNFTDGGVVIGSGTLNASGITSMTVSSLAIGTHTLVASYQGDTVHLATLSPAVAEVVNGATTAVALGTSKNPAIFGDSVVLTAAVTGTGVTATGVVNFTDGGVTIGSSSVNGAGVATYTTSGLAIGTHTMAASYAGDTVHGATVSAGVTQTVLQSTALTLATSAQQVNAGLPVTFTMALTGASGKAITGVVTLQDGGTTIASVTPNAAGTATFTTSGLGVGSHTLTASYAGDALNAAATSNTLLEAVTLAATGTTLTPSANPAFSGVALTLTAVVTGNGAQPTGSVTFSDGGTTLGTGTLNGTGVATLTVTTLTPGTHMISAKYAGDTNNGASASQVLNEQVEEQTTVQLVSSANPALLTDSVSFTATVSNGTSAIPTGTVTLMDGATAVGTVTLNGSGTATFTLTSPALGTHGMVANYSGDATNTAASSTVLVENVVLRPTTNTFTASQTSLSAGQSIVLVSVVQGQGSRQPTGTVTFGSAGAVLGTATINAQGVATVTVTPPQGTYSLVATYSGDTLFASSNSAAVTVTVGPTVAFTMQTTPASMTIASGDRGTLSIQLQTASTFTDTLSLGCAGLPEYATCTFSDASIPVANGMSKTLTVTVDTGNPLGAGASVSEVRGNGARTGAGVLACCLPAGLLMLLAGKRKRLQKPLGLLMALIVLGGMATLSGCANSLTQNKTPAGSYSFRIIGTGNTTGATQSTGVQLTVTQ